jgi:hypothetical protein
VGEQRQLTPGQDWLAAVTDESIRSTAALRGFFGAERAMYDNISFVHEFQAGSRTCLEWEGKFQDKDVAGTTILNRDPSGAIESIRLYHRPYHQVLAFSAERSRRIATIR